MTNRHQPDHAPRVLVAEDDELIRMLIVDALAEAGFKVIEAGHGEEALRILCSRAESFDALFTDINMPGSVDGLELARRARCKLPRLAVVIGSGGCRPPPGALPPSSRFLPKPYHVGDIPNCIRELITHT
jgi:two-component system, response regulator PdtaR